MLYVTNDSGSDVTVTIAVATASSFVPGTGNLTKSDIVATVADGTVAILDPRSIAYRSALNGSVTVTYSAMVHRIKDLLRYLLMRTF